MKFWPEKMPQNWIFFLCFLLQIVQNFLFWASMIFISYQSWKSVLSHNVTLDMWHLLIGSRSHFSHQDTRRDFWNFRVAWNPEFWLAEWGYKTTGAGNLRRLPHGECDLGETPAWKPLEFGWVCGLFDQSECSILVFKLLNVLGLWKVGCWPIYTSSSCKSYIKLKLRSSALSWSKTHLGPNIN